MGGPRLLLLLVGEYNARREAKELVDSVCPVRSLARKRASSFLRFAAKKR